MDNSNLITRMGNALYWAALFQVSWILALWLDGTPAGIAAFFILVLWLLAAIRLLRMMISVKAWFETDSPASLRNAGVGSLAASWNQSRLLRLASSRAAQMPESVRMTLDTVVLWRRMMLAMLIVSPAVALVSVAFAHSA